MKLYVLDTDTLTYWQNEHPVVMEHVRLHETHRIATSIISFEEQLDGWNARLKRSRSMEELVLIYARMTVATRFLTNMEILPFTFNAAEISQRLRKTHRRMDIYDLRIASIALAESAILVTNNTQDYMRIEKLKLANWTIPLEAEENDGN